MAIVNTYQAESWDSVYSAFENINFTSYSYDDVKASLIQYMSIYYPEDFSDFIESSELLAIIELFAYATELLAYRTDLNAHENFITTAQRKQSVLRLAKLISYSAARNIPARGLVKFNTIRTDETVYDSLGNNLANTTITWNDPNNSNWKEQFFLVMNLVLATRFGQPSKAFQVGDVLLQQYTLNNSLSSFRNGVFAFSATGNSDAVSMELVPMDVDENGPLERSPELNSQFSIAYASDGRGDGSDYTGFLGFVKQGTLILTNYKITDAVSNRRLTLNQQNVNNTDVWVYEVDDAGSIVRRWSEVSSVSDETLAFNNVDSRYKYEVETLENDQIALIFGDGNFSAIPVGTFQLWTRVSVNQSINIPKNKISGQPVSFSYKNAQNVTHNCALTFSLTSALQNNAPSEAIEHVRQSAPSTHYAQNRMVNGQDYNTFMLKDSTILKLNSINRTFAGQPKYIEWNDASGAYQNTKLFGDDLTLSFSASVSSVSTTTAAKGIIDSFIEPTLGSTAVLNALVHQMATAVDYVDDITGEGNHVGYGIISFPRRSFIEDNRKIYLDVDGNPVTPYGYQLDGTPLQAGDGSLLEKTVIQGALDGHWYGEPLSTVTINNTVHGVIPDPILNPKSNSRLYISDLPRTIDGVNTYPPGDIGSGLQSIQRQRYFGLKYNRFLGCFGDGQLTFADGTTDFTLNAQGLALQSYKIETITVELSSDGTTFRVTSNMRGQLPNYSLTTAATTAHGYWSEQVDISVPVDFSIVPGTTAFEPGDAFVIDLSYNNPSLNPVGWAAQLRTFGQTSRRSVNLTGWWELIPADVVTAQPSVGGLGIFSSGYDDSPDILQRATFDQSTSGSSWMFLVARKDDDNGNVSEWTIFSRDMKVIASSPTTKFWFNQDTQIIDSETLLPVYDQLRVLRSNLNEYGVPLPTNDIYDCIGFVYDDDGVLVPNSLEILPTGIANYSTTGTATPQTILQFENFSRGAYRFALYRVNELGGPVFDSYVPCDAYTQANGYDTSPYDISSYDNVEVVIVGFTTGFIFVGGNFASSNEVDGYVLVREQFVPAPIAKNALTGDYGCNTTAGLDFMWQHFTPNANLIDPSVSNIHDTYVLTSGYYNSLMEYVRGITSIEPSAPTPLELRTSYGYLLENKVQSDTVVLHPGKVKLLFGALADQKLRAKFRVVMSPTSTLSSERVKQEIINVINQYFDLSNWDFGTTFYATKLLSLIHQALPTQIASVVIVPTYSVNSFGSLFTIEAGLDEVLQSCATVTDVEIVSALSSTVLRQS
jgi:hypothetical protein